MRTTLKRGMGRGAAVNGDVQPVLPPGALSPVTLYRQPEPPGRGALGVVRRLLLWLLVGALMVVTAAAGGVYLFFHQSVAAVAAHTPDVELAQKRLDVVLPGQPATALVIGYDRRANEAAGTPSRSDTIMLIRADPRTKSISLLSFPRDLLVDVRCPGKGSYRGKINEAYSWCGSQGTVETIRSLTDVPINYLITVNFRAFRQIVDKLSGVWLDIDRRYLNTHGGPYGYATINLQPGYQKLGGYQALDFVRFRHTDSDFVRVARQQQFVKALKDRIATHFSALALPKVIKAITSNVEVGVGGGKPPSGKTVLSYALFAYSLPAGHFFQSKIEQLEGGSYVSAPQASIQRAVQEFSNPDVAAPKNATNVALGVKPKAAAPAPRETTVAVLNGNGVTGSASNAGYLLGQRGYVVVTPSGPSADAPTYDYFHTKVYFDGAQPGAQLAAQKVANLFGAADVAASPADIAPLGNSAMLVVVVGQTFHGNLATAPIDQTPAKEAAQVAPGTSATVDLLRERRRKVPFPLLVPTVIDRSSWIDREKPIRLYRVDEQGEHKAIRLTFRSGRGDYWGIEETDWEKAPILAERNFTRRIGGRRYELHYSGPKLHMVVLRRGKATYWVVNTLLDSLSNETMLAIAKGLKPIPRP